jgi:hypothetical protein
LPPRRITSAPHPSSPAFVARTLSLLLAKYENDIDIVRAALLWSSRNPSDILDYKKLSRRLLKARRTDLALWVVYADVEAQRDAASGRNVFSTALSLLPSFPTDALRYAPSLSRSFVEFEANARTLTRDKLLFILGHMWGQPEAEESSAATRTARLRKRLDVAAELIVATMGGGRRGFCWPELPSFEVDTLRCHLWLSAATGGWSAVSVGVLSKLAAALGVGATTAEDVASLAPFLRAGGPSSVLERLIDTALLIADAEIMQPPPPPSAVRSFIARCLEMFPTSTSLFNALLVWEARAAVTRRFRTFVDLKTLRYEQVLPLGVWVATLGFDAQRNAISRVEAVVEQSLQHS